MKNKSLKTIFFYHWPPHGGETGLLHNKGMSHTYCETNDILRHECNETKNRVIVGGRCYVVGAL